MSADFLSIHVPALERRFQLSYFQDDSCVAYYLDARGTERQVSQNLILSRDPRCMGVYVSKFYPQLFLEASSKYLSSACFYLLVCHAVHLFHLKDECPVWLETDIRVFRQFYVKLKGFDFCIHRARVGERVCLHGIFHESPVQVAEIPVLSDPFARL
jgi:hypothetical protein